MLGWGKFEISCFDNMCWELADYFVGLRRMWRIVGRLIGIRRRESMISMLGVEMIGIRLSG